MNKLKKFFIGGILTSILLISTSFTAHAAAYYNKTFTLKQPDNTEVEVKITGDEYYQHIESIDGYTLCRNEEGWICYADINSEKSELLPTDKIYTGENYVEDISVWDKLFKNKSKKEKHITLDKEYSDKLRDEVKEKLNVNEIEKSQKNTFNKYKNLKASSSTEEIKGLTLLIDFSDTTSAISRDELENFFNQSGYRNYGNNGSVKDYFYDVSGGAVTYTNTITEFYRAKYPKSYYDRDEGYDHALELVYEALDWLKSTGFDFSTLSTDENGFVRGVNILYAGTADAGWSNGLWPHQGYLTDTFYSDGVAINRYELSNIGTDLSLDTVCHENGHLLFGFNDFYDYTGKSGGCGAYDIMSYINNPKNPAPPNPYCRNVISGWNNTINLNNYSDNTTITANSSTNGTHDVYRWSKNNSREYYLIENVEKEGRYASVPDEGLLIWHVDEKGNNSNYENTSRKHYELSLVQADNKLEIEKNINSGGYGDLFHKDFNDKFTNDSFPNSKWWDGSSSGLSLTNISQKGKAMTFIKNASSSNVDPYVPSDNIIKLNNIASKASISTSNCSSWESISALNDGFTPSNSNDRAHVVYGNWPSTSEEWVQYTFDTNQIVSKSNIYWFKDNAGIDVPSSYTIQYYDGFNWVDVQNPVGLGTEANTFNTTYFNPIITSSIRIKINPNNSYSTGILEWQLF